MSKKFTIIAVVAVIMLMLAGCGKPPETEIQNATAAFNAAKAAEAEQYAPEAYRAAMDTLNAAMAAKQEQDSKFALFRGYGKAKELYIKAEAMAKDAETRAAAEKEKVKAQVTDMLAQAQAALTAANDAIKKAPRGKGSQADIEMMKNDLATAQAGYDDAMNDFNAGKYLAAKTKVQVVIDKANSIVNEIQTATAKKK